MSIARGEEQFDHESPKRRNNQFKVSDSFRRPCAGDCSPGPANATPLSRRYLFRVFVVSSFRVPFSEFEVTTNRVPGSVPLSEQGPAEIEQKVTKITKGRNRSGTGRRALLQGVRPRIKSFRMNRCVQLLLQALQLLTDSRISRVSGLNGARITHKS